MKAKSSKRINLNVVFFALGVIIGMTAMSILIKPSRSEKDTSKGLSPPQMAEHLNFFTEKVQDAELITELKFEEQEPELEPEPLIRLTPLGEYTITAYCSCETCCGDWALNRPIDPVTGEPIVKGAANVILQPGVSVASPLPFGTSIYIDGLGNYIVHDRTAQRVADYYDVNVIDIYFTDHQEAGEFGKQHREVFIIEGGQKNE